MKKLFTLIIFSFLVIVIQAQPISQLPAASSVNPADLIPIVQIGVTKKATAAQVISFIRDSLDNVRIISDTCLEVSYRGMLDTICFSQQDLNWEANGDDIQNTNSGKITAATPFYFGDSAYARPDNSNLPILADGEPLGWVLGTRKGTGQVVRVLLDNLGDSTAYSGGGVWAVTGNDIANDNTGKVILPKDSTYFSGILDKATKVGRILHQNQYGKVEYTTPITLYDSMRTQYKDSIGIDITPPGLEWTLRTAPSNITWQSITYGNGLFVAVGFGGTTQQIMTSPDGVTWTARTTIDNDWIGVTYANGLFVTVSDDGTVNDSLLMYSTDGINWTAHYNNHQSAKNVCFGNPGSSLPKWVKVNATSTDNVGYSLNGLDYTMQTVSGSHQLFDVCYGNGKFVAVGNNDSTIYSTDGINWTGTPCTHRSWTSVIYANGLFVACCNTLTTDGVMTSPDGITWTDRATPAFVYSLAYGNGLFVGVGSFGRIMTSPDAITWTRQTEPATTAWHDIVYGNGMFVAIGGPNGAGNAIMTSGAILSKITQLNNITNGDYKFTGVVEIDNTLTMNNKNIDEVGLINTSSITYTEPLPWMDSYRKAPFYFCEFLNVNAATLDPWYGAVVSGGSLSISGEANHPGVFACGGAGGANQGYRVATIANTITLTGGESYNLVFSPIDTTNLLLRAGFIDVYTSTDQTDGAYFEVIGSSLIGKTASTSTRTSTSTGYYITDGVWYSAKLLINADASRVDFYLYNESGTLLWTDNITTNIPTGLTSNGFVALETIENGSDVIKIDFMSMSLGTLIR